MRKDLRAFSVVVLGVLVCLAAMPAVAAERELAPLHRDDVSTEAIARLLERPATEAATRVADALARSGVEVAPGSPATYLERDAETSIVLVAVQPVDAAAERTYRLAMIVDGPEGAVPFLLDLADEGLKMQLLGTDAAAILTPAGDTADVRDIAPFAPRRVSAPFSGGAVVQSTWSEKFACIRDHFAFSGDFVCALGEYAYCVAAAQPSLGAFVGCARPILRSLLAKSKNKASMCEVAVELVQLGSCLFDNSNRNTAPAVTLQASVKNAEITLQAVATDKEGGLSSFSIFRGTTLLQSMPNIDCFPASDWKSATCTAVFNAKTFAQSNTSATFSAEVRDFLGQSAKAEKTVSLRFTASGNAGGLANVKLTIPGTSFSTTSKSGGSYTFTNLPPGTYKVVPERANCGFLPPNITINVGPDATNVNFTKSGAACK